MLPIERIEFECEQFVWGKILQGGQDVSGYKIVARSNGLSEKICAEVLARTGAGFSEMIIQGRRAYAFFNISSQKIVFCCTQRSQITESLNRYYLQTHFLVCELEKFEAIHADLSFLASMIDTIPTFEKDETLDLFKATYKRNTSVESGLQGVITKYPVEFLENTYRALKGKSPVAIFDSSEDEFRVLALFQLLYLLLHPSERKELTFASMASGMEVGKYKFKVNPTGALKQPHIVVRLSDTKVVPPNLVEELPTTGLFHFRARMKEIVGEMTG